MTLHEAILHVLRDANQTLTSSEIAKRVNEKNLYQRGDGSLVPASQISSRINNYPQLFLKYENQTIGINERGRVKLDEIVLG